MPTEYDIRQIQLPNGDICKLKTSERIKIIPFSIKTSDWNGAYTISNSDTFITNSTLGIIQLDDSYYNLRADLIIDTNDGNYKLTTALKPWGTISGIILFYKNLEGDSI